MEISLPSIHLRPYQVDIWNKCVCEDVKKSFIVWHRRAGKDLTSIQIIVAWAMLEKGNYWYLLPQQNQVRRSIWEGITKDGVKYLDTIPKELVFARKESEMKIILRDPQDPSKPGSIISFLGGDNYNSLAGSGIKGCVISELALQKPSLYDLIIEPMLKETKGKVLFNSTPRGEGYAKDMFDFLAKKEEYYTSLLTIEDTGVVDPADLEEERERGKPEEIIQQEYYCSWQGSIYGAYYADALKKAKFGEYPYDPRHPVFTMWDIGVDDAMAIWFAQIIDGAIRIIDYYENNTYGLGHYAQIVLGKPYERYSYHFLPHDGSHRQLTADEKSQSIQSQLMKLGLSNIKLIPRTNSVIEDIYSVRGILPLCSFNLATTKDGVSCLKQYHREYDEKRRKFKDTPEHDWTSHGADAFRILPFAEKIITKPQNSFKSKTFGGIKW